MRKKNIESFNNLTQGQLNERERIARDLHDGITPQLASLFVNFDNFTLDNENIMKAKIRNDLSKSISQIRQIAHDIMPINFSEIKFKVALEDYFVQFKKQYTIILDMEDTMELSQNESQQLYYIALELFNNTIKYANASEIKLVLKQNDKSKYFEYTDNGNGFNRTTTNKGLGLKNIESRTTILNGKIEKFETNKQFCIKIAF